MTSGQEIEWVYSFNAEPTKRPGARAHTSHTNESGVCCECTTVISPHPLSLRLNGHFPDGSGLAGTRTSPFWILLELRMMEVVVTTGAIRHAKVQWNRHHQQTNTNFFYRPDVLPVTQPTVSELWRKSHHIHYTTETSRHQGRQHSTSKVSGESWITCHHSVLYSIHNWQVSCWENWPLQADNQYWRQTPDDESLNGVPLTLTACTIPTTVARQLFLPEEVQQTVLATTHTSCLACLSQLLNHHCKNPYIRLNLTLLTPFSESSDVPTKRRRY